MNFGTNFVPVSIHATPCSGAEIMGGMVVAYIRSGKSTFVLCSPIAG